MNVIATMKVAMMPDTFDMLMILPNELREMSREAKEKAEAVEPRCLQEGIDVWRQGTSV